MSLTVGVVITTHPQDELVSVSDSVNFTCEASGSSPISYRWLYIGNYIMEDPGHIEGVNTTTLMIVNVTFTDWGMYSCEASNIVNDVTSNEATLHGELCVTTLLKWVVIVTSKEMLSVMLLMPILPFIYYYSPHKQPQR